MSFLGVEAALALIDLLETASMVRATVRSRVVELTELMVRGHNVGLE